MSKKIRIHNLKASIKDLKDMIDNPTGFFKNKSILKYLNLKLLEKRKELASLINKEAF